MRELSPILRAAVAKRDRTDGSRRLAFWMHCLDAAGIIERLARERLAQNVFCYLSSACGGEAMLFSVLIFCALVHDIGKLTLLFQARIAAVGYSPFSEYIDLPKPESFRNAKITPHAYAGEAILLKKGCPWSIASIVGAHHGKPFSNQTDSFIEELTEDFPANFYGRSKKYRKEFQSLWDEWVSFSLEYSGINLIKELPEIPMPAQVLIEGLLIMADWIASNTTYFPLLSADECGQFSDYPARIDAAWEKLSLPAPWISGACFGFGVQDFKNRFGFMPNPTQEEVLNIVSRASFSGIFILEAPMGLGKTEAALAAAEILAAKSGAGGLFLGMPTQATSNGIFPRLEAWAQGISQDEGVIHSIRLAHAAAALNDDYREIFEGHSDLNDESAGLIVHDWFSGRKQALLSDFVIGTVDGLLMSALKQKHVMLRHLGLAGKVVIVDECHAYDAYMSRYLDTAIKWLGIYGVPVIILSATLPEKRRAELIEAYCDKIFEDESWKHSLSYPLLTYADNGKVYQSALPYNGDKKQILVKRISREEVAARVGDAINCGGCIGVIVNTVKKAQDIARELQSSFPENEIIIMHAQFIMSERIAREKRIIARVGKNSTPNDRRGLIVVGTQVLEQSLDLDFDMLITELCPMDLLLQRIGRLHRHDRVRPNGLENAKCYVLDNMNGGFDEGSEAIYGRWLLMRTRALLPDMLTVPNDISSLVQRTYDENDMLLDASEETDAAQEKYDLTIAKKERSAQNYCIPDPPNFTDCPWMNTLDGWLDDSIRIGEQYAQMAVRDGDPSIDVIALRHGSDGLIHPIAEQPEVTLPTDRPPSREESLLIARQKLRLPAYFTKRWNADKTIEELENTTAKFFSYWQESALLKDELALLFDEDLNAEINEAIMHYDLKNGLSYEKE